MVRVALMVWGVWVQLRVIDTQLVRTAHIPVTVLLSKGHETGSGPGAGVYFQYFVLWPKVWYRTVGKTPKVCVNRWNVTQVCNETGKMYSEMYLPDPYDGASSQHQRVSHPHGQCLKQEERTVALM